MTSAAARAAVGHALRSRHPAIVAIDGPSGAGKSTLAEAAAADWRARPRIIRLDEVYRGWHGLEEGARELARGVVPAQVAGRVGRTRGWDWAESLVLPPRAIAPGRPLIVEGCGAFAATAGAPRVLRVWVDAPLGRRRDRALARDEGRFDPYWDLWETEWRRHLARHGGRPRADVVVRG